MLEHFPNLLARLRRFRATSPSGPARSAPTIDVARTVEDALNRTGGATRLPPAIDVARTIEDALTRAGLRGGGGAANDPVDSEARGADGADERTVIDGEFRVVETGDAKGATSGQFLARSYANAADTRPYKLYVPASLGRQFASARGLLVMLHGCTQSPDDFAAGTRMNALAEEFGIVVVYPQQTGRANGSQCWNWFRPQDQQRDGGEPALIAGMTREIATQYGIDRAHTYVAGLSAGAAMAVILGQTYPDVFAAVGAHSGLAYGAAHDVPSALGVMRGADPANVPGIAARAPTTLRRTPTIVFHGDGDRTVALKNGAAIIDQVVRDDLRNGALRANTLQGATTSGRAYTRHVYNDAEDRPVGEYWVLHGAGHAWSGGSVNGSFTEPGGPDASAEMMRFFGAHKRAQ